MTTDTTQHAWWWRLKEALLWQSGRHPLRILTALSLGGLSLGVLSGVVGTLLLTTSALTPEYGYVKTNLQTHYGATFILTCESPELRAVNDWPETHINGVWLLCWETER